MSINVSKGRLTCAQLNTGSDKNPQKQYLVRLTLATNVFNLWKAFIKQVQSHMRKEMEYIHENAFVTAAVQFVSSIFEKYLQIWKFHEI